MLLGVYLISLYCGKNCCIIIALRYNLYLLFISVGLSSGTTCKPESLEVRISTIPREAPFRIHQRVQFLCEVETAQSDPVVYKWKAVDDISESRNYSGGNFITTYGENSLRYCWYYCTVHDLNGTVLGSSDKLIEVHGKCAVTCMCMHTHRHTYFAIILSLSLFFWGGGGGGEGGVW